MSKYFSDKEFTFSQTAIDKGIKNEVPVYLKMQMLFTLAGMDRIREALGKPIKINSGYRCQALNEAVGGSPKSQHMVAEAVDFTCPAYGNPKDIGLFLSQKMGWLGIDQIIMEGTWVHVSFTLTPRYEVLTRKGTEYVPGIV
jgi:putative chitinase